MEFFNSSEHIDFITHIAIFRVNNNENVIKEAIKGIEIETLSDEYSLKLLNSLIKLGFISEEWKEDVLEKLVEKLNIEFLTKINMIDAFKTLNSLWMLGQWPSNRLILVIIYYLSFRSKHYFKEFSQILGSLLNWQRIYYIW